MSTQAKVILSAEDRTAAAFASAMRNVDKLGFNFDTLKAGAIGALSALAVPVSVAGIASVFNESRKAIDGLKDLADASGASVGNLSALDNIARSTGGNLETVSSILVKFNGVLADADPSKGVGATLKAIGLSVEELKRLDPAEALRVTAVEIEKLGSETDKARVYQELFGKATRDAAPFLKDLAEAKRLDAKLTDEQVEQVDRFNKEMAKLQASAGNAARSLSVVVAGALNTVIDRFKEGQKEGKNFWQIALEGYKKDVAGIYGAGGGGVSPGRVSSGGIIDASDPRAALRAIERAQDTRPNASVLPPSARSVGGGSSSARTGSAGTSGMSDAERAVQDYNDFQKKAAADLDRYLQTRHAKRLDEEEREEKDYRQRLDDYEREQSDYVQARHAKRIKEQEDAEKDAADSIKKAQEDQAKSLGAAYSATFNQMFTEGMKFGDLLKKLAFDTINIGLLTPATQKIGKSLGTAASKLFSFDGGGYTGSGSRSGGLDGKGGFMAVLHPNETVLDHTRGQGGGGGITISQVFSFQAAADSSTVAQLKAVAGQIKAETLAAVQSKANRGGSFSAALGRA